MRLTSPQQELVWLHVEMRNGVPYAKCRLCAFHAGGFLRPNNALGRGTYSLEKSTEASLKVLIDRHTKADEGDHRRGLDAWQALVSAQANGEPTQTQSIFDLGQLQALIAKQSEGSLVLAYGVLKSAGGTGKGYQAIHWAAKVSGADLYADCYASDDFFEEATLYFGGA